MFSEEAIRQIAQALAPAIAAELAKRQGKTDWPEAMTLETVAKYLNCKSIHAARAMMDGLERAGEIRRCELDGRIRYRKVDVDKMLERKS